MSPKSYIVGKCLIENIYPVSYEHFFELCHLSFSFEQMLLYLFGLFHPLFTFTTLANFPVMMARPV